MNGPDTFWLTVTNIALGAIVLILILTVVTGVVCDCVARIRARCKAVHSLDRELRDLFHPRG